MKDGTGINPEPEVISKSVHRRLAVQRPEQDEIREAFEESGPIRYYIKNYNIHFSYAKDGYCLVTNGKTGLHHIKEAIKEINHKWDNFKHGYTSRNAEIEEKDRIINDLKKISHDHVSYMSELSKKETEIEALKSEQHDYDLAILNLNQTIEELKAEIESMREFIQLVAEWENAYPEEVFPPIGKDSYYSMCKAAGFSVDRVSAHALRPIIKSYSDMAINFLKEDPK